MIDQSKKRALQLLNEKLPSPNGDLKPIVSLVLGQKAGILELVKKHGTPFYCFDGAALRQNLDDFDGFFRKTIPRLKPFYAMKANDQSLLLNQVVKKGFGLDVSSGRELEIALKHKPGQIIFSGPGKTLQELELAVKYSSRVTVNIDSFRELEKLEAVARKAKRTMRAGVRVFMPSQGAWNKFGIPLGELRKFWDKTAKCPHVRLEGIQFHSSWNVDPTRYEKLIAEVAGALKKDFTSEQRQSIKFIDMGGGFYPHRQEGAYPWAAHYPWTPPVGKLLKIADAYYGEETDFETKYSITESVPLKKYAEVISRAVTQYLKPLVDCDYYVEPGRILSYNTMHVVLSVEDIKRPGMLIADGGVNIQGWEYGEFFYFPIVNLTHPAMKEIKTTVYGPLCTPHDIWGYYVYASMLSEGDVLVVPNQGAYRTVLAQNFIKPIPPVYALKNKSKGLK